MPKRHPRAVVVVTTLCALLLLPHLVSAQVGPSLRLRSIGVDFDGFIDDAVTDAARNPARLGSFRGSGVYTGVFPVAIPLLRFPTVVNYTWEGLLPTETYDGWRRLPLASSTSRDVTGLTGIRAGGEWTRSLTVFGNVSASDEASAVSSARQTDSPWPGMVESIEDADGGRAEFEYAGLDVALSNGTGPASKALGFRLRASYLSLEDERLNVDSETAFRTTSPDQRTLDYRLRNESWVYEQLDLGLTAGLFRPASTLREVVLTVAAGRVSNDVDDVEQNIRDDDADGDGSDPGGSSVDYNFSLGEARTSREYDRLGAGVGVLLSHGSRVRSYHCLSFARLDGDGIARMALESVQRDAGMEDRSLVSADYVYDGNIDRVDASSAVGIVEEVTDDLRVAGVLRASYRRDDFDETGDGAGSLVLDDVTFDSPFRQKLAVKEEFVFVSVAFGAEWAPRDVVALQFGLRHQAQRLDSEALIRRRAQLLEVELGAADAGLESVNAVSYSATTDLTLGVGVRLADRLFLDLHSGWERTGASLTDYRHIAALFYF